jgi:hypothetical protein
MSIIFRIDGSVLDYKEEVVVDVKGSTVGECFDYVIQRQASLKKALLDENNSLNYGNFIKINGEYVISDTLKMTVKDGDKIEILKILRC